MSLLRKPLKTVLRLYRLSGMEDSPNNNRSSPALTVLMHLCRKPGRQLESLGCSCREAFEMKNCFIRSTSSISNMVERLSESLVMVVVDSALSGVLKATCKEPENTAMIIG